ncbi:MAG TPA: hypothetical protein PKA41_01765 [Verrucomicrobiota bacterium]|nr:hypothetical protein [Verrucomicrobiota bacterium]
MTRKIAVAIIHGVGTQKPDFAEPITAELTKRFSALIKGHAANPQSELVIEPVHWAPVLQRDEDELWNRLLKGGELDFIGLRKFMVSFAADAIAYQPAPKERDAYENIHVEVARALRRLAGRDCADAPLVVIAHSLGTVIASNYFYDLEKDARKKFIPAVIRREIGKTPLERGETFTSLYTFGSPIALWSLRYTDFGKPITVPSPLLTNHHPGLEAASEWINFYDKDDIIGYPLRRLNDAYRKAVKEDRQVNAGGLFSSWNPLSHNGYWTDNDVTKPIAEGLARVWKRANGI